MITSSPSPPRLPSATPNLTRANTNEEIEILSDDFNTTYVSSDAVLTTTNGNKRRRISRSPSCSQPPGEPLKRVSTPPIALNLNKPPSSDDPFASSPRPVAQPAESLPVAVELPDPFASSPIPISRSKGKNPISRPVKDATTDRRHEIEGISSPAASQINRKSRHQQWDPISSSAPEVSGGPSGRTPGDRGRPQRRCLGRGDCYQPNGSHEADASRGPRDAEEWGWKYCECVQ